MTCSFPFPLNPPISLHNSCRTRHIILLSPPPLFSKSTFSRSLSNSHICFTSYSNPDRTEEFLWLREEQRWLREEQRWLREEQRWLQERDSLLAQIQSLKLRIQALENQVSAQAIEVGAGGAGGGGGRGGDMAVNVAALLQVLKERNLIAESWSSTGSNSVVVDKNVQEEVMKEVAAVNGREKERRTLRRGSEGLEVHEMQV